MHNRICTTCAILISSTWHLAGETNLLRNPDFEQGTNGWHLPRTYSVTGEQAHGGTKSLKVANTNAALYSLGRQPISFEPGLRYRFGAWIKTKGVTGDESGAAVCMEWTGAKGWLGGAYPEGRKGDNDWTYVEGMTPPIPAEVKSIDFKLYLRKGMTGEAWFDGATVSPVWPNPVDAQLLRPNYRGWILPGQTNQGIIVRALVADRFRDGIDRSQLRLLSELVAADGAIKGENVIGAPTPGEHDIAIDGASLPPGRYRVRLRLVAGDSVLGSKEFPIRKWAPDEPLPKVYIDEFSRTIAGGKPFFPLGWYFGPGPTAKDFTSHIDRVAASPFNTIMCYGINAGGVDKVRAYLDYLHQKQVKIIYSIKDVYAGTKYFHEPVLGYRGEENIVRNVVAAFRDHPAVLGWYLNDELPPSMRDRLEARQRLVTELDPDHPTWAVLYQVNELFDYLATADVLGTDPYPIPTKPAAIAGEWTKKTVGVSAGNRPVWMVPQAFDWSHYGKGRKGRFPTPAELRVMTFLCLIHGADGLIYYCYHDLLRDKDSFEKNWADMSAVAREVRSLEPALVSCMAPKIPEIQADEGVEWSARADDGGRTYIMMANAHPERRATVNVLLPANATAELIRGDRKQTAAERFVELAPMDAATLVIR